MRNSHNPIELAHCLLNMSESSEWLNGHGQQESVATLVDAGPAEQVRESKAQLPPLSPSSPIIVEGDPSVIPPEHPFRTLVLWKVLSSIDYPNTDSPFTFVVLMELAISSMEMYVHCWIFLSDSNHMPPIELEHCPALHSAEEG